MIFVLEKTLFPPPPSSSLNSVRTMKLESGHFRVVVVK